MKNVNLTCPLEIHPQAGQKPALLQVVHRPYANFGLRAARGLKYKDTLACGPMWCSPMTLWHCGTFCSLIADGLIYTAFYKSLVRTLCHHMHVLRSSQLGDS